MVRSGAQVLTLIFSTTVTGVLTAVDGKQNFLHITQLSTPLYVYPETLVRVSDVLSVEIIP